MNIFLNIFICMFMGIVLYIVVVVVVHRLMMILFKNPFSLSLFRSLTLVFILLLLLLLLVNYRLVKTICFIMLSVICDYEDGLCSMWLMLNYGIQCTGTHTLLTGKTFFTLNTHTHTYFMHFSHSFTFDIILLGWTSIPSY